MEAKKSKKRALRGLIFVAILVGSLIFTSNILAGPQETIMSPTVTRIVATEPVHQKIVELPSPTMTPMPILVVLTVEASLLRPSDPLLVRIVDKNHPVDWWFVLNIRTSLVNVGEACTRQGMKALIWNTPSKAHEVAVNDLCGLMNASYEAGSRLTLRSAFRDLKDQEEARKQTDFPDRVLLPGESQHHTGLAFDFTSPSVGYQLVSEFNNTPEYKFLVEHGWEFGFVESYVADHDGVIQEPWHWVYLGPELARKYLELKAQGIVKDPFEFQALYPQP